MYISGEYCERKIPFCTEQYNPCENNARCVDHDSYYTCECLPGFKGENCSSNVDDCENHMCQVRFVQYIKPKNDIFAFEIVFQNGATCVDGINEYICKCSGDFTGKFCEISPIVSMMYPQTSPCQHHDCVHGVCFQPSGLNDYVCKCAPGYSGKLHNVCPKSFDTIYLNTNDSTFIHDKSFYTTPNFFLGTKSVIMSSTFREIQTCYSLCQNF